MLRINRKLGESIIVDNGVRSFEIVIDAFSVGIASNGEKGSGVAYLSIDGIPLSCNVSEEMVISDPVYGDLILHVLGVWNTSVDLGFQGDIRRRIFRKEIADQRQGRRVRDAA